VTGVIVPALRGGKPRRRDENCVDQALVLSRSISA